MEGVFFVSQEIASCERKSLRQGAHCPVDNGFAPTEMECSLHARNKNCGSEEAKSADIEICLKRLAWKMFCTFSVDIRGKINKIVTIYLKIR